MEKYSFDSENHIHKIGDKPLCGTSTVCGIIAKPLTWWASGMAVSVMGWSNKKITDKNVRLEKAKGALQAIKELEAPEYLDLLDKAYQAHNEKKEISAEAGTDMHALLEKYVKLMITDQAGLPMEMNSYEHPAVEQFVKWAKENVKRFLASEIYLYSREQWLGGICDVIYEDLKGDTYIGDFKSSKDAYFSQFLQTALYHIQLTENNGGFDKDGNKILELNGGIKGYAIFPFGSDFKEPTIRYASEDWTMAGIGAVKLYKLNQATN